jgi:hypothetical protein
MDRIEECPSFCHLLDLAFNQIFIDHKKFAKNESHKCSPKIFLKTDEEAKKYYEEIFMTQMDHGKHCSCTCLDLTMQTNNLLE